LARLGIGPPRSFDKPNAEINASLADPKLKARFADLGCIALNGSPADFARLIAEETEKWAKVVKFPDAKPDRSSGPARIFYNASISESLANVRVGSKTAGAAVRPTIRRRSRPGGGIETSAARVLIFGPWVASLLVWSTSLWAMCLAHSNLQNTS
jgi:hypothetical protein